MELPDELPGATVPVVHRFPLPDLRPADVIPRAPLASDALAAVPPDEAAVAAIPALAAVPCAEKLAAPAQVVRAQTAEALPPPVLPAQAAALCIPGAGRFAA